jgi:hypothetical protein
MASERKRGLPRLTRTAQAWNISAFGCLALGFAAMFVVPTHGIAFLVGVIGFIVCLGIGTWCNVRVSYQVARHDSLACTTCGYDLRRSPSKGRCPECGCEYTHDQVRRDWREWSVPTTNAGPAARDASDPPYVRRTRRWTLLGIASIPLAVVVGYFTQSEILALVAFFAGPVLALAMMAWHNSRLMQAAHDVHFDLCPFCAYDLSGTPGEVCPECGRAMDRAAARAHWRDWCTRR